MKMKNGNQYKIQKSQDGGGNNAYKTLQARSKITLSTVKRIQLSFLNLDFKLFCLDL